MREWIRNKVDRLAERLADRLLAYASRPRPLPPEIREWDERERRIHAALCAQGDHHWGRDATCDWCGEGPCR
jgi:hypothetical protein